MKTLFLLALALLLPGSLHARTWVVDNDTTRPADFRTPQAAHDAAASDDTLLFVGSANHYGDLVISKKIHLIGPGYNLEENNIPSANLAAATLPAIMLVPAAGGEQPAEGASGSSFRGVQCHHIGMLGGVNDISIDQCDLGVVSAEDPGSHNHGLVIKRSFVIGIDLKRATAVVHNSRISIIIVRTFEVVIDNEPVKYGSSLVMSHVVLGSPVNSDLEPDTAHLPSTVTITNSIILGGVPFRNGLNINNSLLFSDVSTHPGNRDASGEIPSKVFSYTLTASRPWEMPMTEAEFRLNDDPDNPAKGYALGGGDVGMYGGSWPYQLSGIPALPRVTSLSTSGLVSDTVGLTLIVGGEVRD